MADTLTVRCTGGAQGVYLVDRGRPNYRDRGIARGGPADPVAAATANRLLGQDPGSCCLELTLTGGGWQFSGRGQIVLTGANMNWRLNGVPVDRYRVLDLVGENKLHGGAARRQCRAYLGIRGEWAGPRVLGSMEVGLPGTRQPGEAIELCITSTQRVVAGEEIPPLLRAQAETLLLSASPAPEWCLLTLSQQARLIDRTYTVSSRSNRQGIRLDTVGEPLHITLPSMLSSPVLPGTVQFAPAGPILLGPDAQTVGGYPRVLQLSELGDAYQLPPGGRLRFVLDQTVRS